MAVITLLTDFGTADEYVGLMKGVIASIAPSVKVIDITHAIDDQDLVQAAHAIRCSYTYFPKGSIHLLIVDPGVGSRRAVVGLSYNGHHFIAPDNGVLTLILQQKGPKNVYRMNREAFYRKPVSQTFHGRDIFAPLGAHLANGIPLAHMGRRIIEDDLVQLCLPAVKITPGGQMTGTIITIDRFGNLITNIAWSAILKNNPGRPIERIQITLGDTILKGLVKYYQSVGPGEPLAIIGSRGMLEISVNGGSAKKLFMARKGDPIGISFGD
jgi:S-adenosylmethionine hydrolase